MEARTNPRFNQLDIVAPNTRGAVDMALGEERLRYLRENLKQHTPENLMLLLTTVQRDAANSGNLYQKGVADTLQYLLGITKTPPVVQHK